MSEPLRPHWCEHEPHATLQCGDVTVHLSYTALHLMLRWLRKGAEDSPYPWTARPILQAFEAIDREAGRLSVLKHKERRKDPS